MPDLESTKCEERSTLKIEKQKPETNNAKFCRKKILLTPGM